MFHLQLTKLTYCREKFICELISNEHVHGTCKTATQLEVDEKQPSDRSALRSTI